MSASITASFQGRTGRTAVVAMATSGLVFGVSAAATAEPETPDVIKAPSLKSMSLSAKDVQRAGTQVSVVVDAGAEIGFAAALISAEAPPPPPPPPPVRTVTAASRTRTAPAVAQERSTVANDEAGDSTSEVEAEAEAEIETASAPAPSGGTVDALIAEAYSHVGTPYSQMDCSKFVQTVFASIGVSLPRTSSAQASAGYRVSASEARAGDLIYSPGHIGIYLGDGQHIAARNPSTPLKAGPVYMSSPTYIRVLG